MRPTQLSSVDLNLLRVADALLETASVTETAALVHLSQPAVSRALSRLRAQLGNDLLVRDGRGMVVTPFGKELRPRLRAALLSLERTLFSAEEFQPKRATGTFTIASQDFAAFSFLPEALAHPRTRGPSHRHRGRPLSRALEELLETNEVDVTVGPRPSERTWIRSEPLFSSDWVVVGAASNGWFRRPSLDSFCNASHVLVSPRGQGGGPVDEALARRKKQRRIRLRVPDFAAAIAVAAQTDLLVVVPEALAASAQSVHEVRSQALPITLPPVRIFLSWHVARNGDAASPGFASECARSRAERAEWHGLANPAVDRSERRGHFSLPVAGTATARRIA